MRIGSLGHVLRQQRIQHACALNIGDVAIAPVRAVHEVCLEVARAVRGIHNECALGVVIAQLQAHIDVGCSLVVQICAQEVAAHPAGEACTVHIGNSVGSCVYVRQRRTTRKPAVSDMALMLRHASGNCARNTM